MIDTTHKLPVTRQAELLDLSRSNVYYLPRPISAADLGLMRQIDELHLNFPFAGARMLRDMLKLEGVAVGRKHVRTLMERMGIAAIYRKRNTSAPHPAHPIYPYLLKDLTIDRATRRVLAHRVSISMTADFCVEALEEAIAKYGTPEIFNTDQGSQFTSDDFTKVLKAHQIKISMDGKGRWIDNVFVERLWRSVKYEHVYLHAYESVAEARQQLTRYFTFYNTRRPHTSLGGMTPDTAYFGTLATRSAA